MDMLTSLSADGFLFVEQKEGRTISNLKFEIAPRRLRWFCPSRCHGPSARIFEVNKP
jgi:hypothetical protein